MHSQQMLPFLLSLVGKMAQVRLPPMPLQTVSLNRTRSEYSGNQLVNVNLSTGARDFQEWIRLQLWRIERAAERSIGI